MLLRRYGLWFLAALLTALMFSRPALAADWAKNFGGDTTITGTAVDGSGNTYITGYFAGASLTLGTTTLSRIGTQDAFAAKLDANGSVLWAKNFGGSGANAGATGIVVDASGNVVLGGYFNANLTTPTLTKIGTQDAFALKLDGSGAVVWGKNYGGSGATAQANGIAVDGSGNVYLGGYFKTANLTTPVLTRIGVQDAFAFKLDASGVTTWAKSYGGSGTSAWATGIAADGSGNVYLGGYYQDGDFTTPVLARMGAQDAFAFKLDASGAITWAKGYGASGAIAQAKGIAVDGSGNVYLGGTFNAANLTTPALTRIGIQDAFALKLDSSGVTAWAKNYGGAGTNAFATGIAVDAAGNVYLGGYFQDGSFSTPTLARVGARDVFAFKLDSSGTTAWLKRYGGTGGTMAWANGIAVDGSGNLYLGGNFSGGSLTAPALTAIGSQTALVLRQSTLPPILNSIAPTSGSVAGGTVVTLTGYNFTGATSVKFGANNGTALTVNSATSITVTTPAGSSGIGAVDVVVTHANGSNPAGNGLFSYFDVPAQPTAPNVTVTGNVALVSFTAPAANGTTITGYTVISSPVGGVDIDAGSLSTTHRIVGLAAGTTYSFSVVATNAMGSSIASSGTSASTAASLANESFGSFGTNTNITGTAVDGTGNTYVSGTFTGATLVLGATTLTRIGVQDAFVAKLNSSGNVLWAKNYGGSGGYAAASGIAVDGSGNVYLGGFFNADLSTPSLARVGLTDAFAFKLDGSGTLTWAKNFGGTGAHALGKAIAIDGSGNVYLDGYFSSGNLTVPALTKLGTQDAFAVKLDGSGTTAWAKNFGGAGASAIATAIAVDSSGNVYLGGYVETANLSTPAVTLIGARDAFAFKLDSSGTTTWARNFGGSGGASVYAKGMALDGTGNVYLVGYFEWANLTTPALTLIGGVDAFAFKLDSTGSTTWARSYGGAGANAYATGVAVDGSGSVHLGGYFQGANLSTPGLSLIGGSDAFAVKLDSGGTSTWTKNFGGSGAAVYLQAIAVDALGNFMLGGYFEGTHLSTPALTLIGAQDAFLFKQSVQSSQLPVVASISPTHGVAAGGTAVTVTGFNFTGATGVKFGANSGTALTVHSTNSLTVTTPASSTGFGAVDVVVTNASGSNASGNGLFNYFDPPAQAAAPNVTVTGNVALVSFTPPAANGSAITGYSVITSPAGGVDLDAGSLATTHRIVGLVAGTTYNFTVVAVNGGGSTSSSATAVVTAGSPTRYVGLSFGNLAGSDTNIATTAVDGTGNTYVAGTFNSATLALGAVTLTKIGAIDVFVMKIGAGGTVLWAKNFGGNGATASTGGIAVDGSGNVYLGGHFGSNLTTPALTLMGAQDVFAFKLDSSGNVTWAKNFGGSGTNAWATGIAVDGSGNVFLGGYYQDGNFSTPSLTRIGARDAFAFKLDSNGATVWAKSYGGSGVMAEASGIAADASGNAYLSGSFTGANLTTPALTKIGNWDSFAFKLDSAGATTWAKNYGSSGANAYAKGIAVDGSGNVYLGGYFQGANLSAPALTLMGGTDVFAFKLDSSGATTWAKNFGGSGATTVASGIAVDGAGNVYLGGWFYTGNLTTPALTLIGTQDAFAFKLNASGVLTWARNFGGSGATAPANSIAVDASENIYLGGQFNANLSAPALTKFGTRDAYILQQNTAVPLVVGLSPASGVVGGGTVTTLSGFNFSGVTGVKFGANSGTALTVNSATSLTVTTPASSTGVGAVDVVVTNAAGSNLAGNGLFAYLDGPAQPAAPTVVLIGNIAFVSFTPPAANGSVITGYTVITSPAGGVDIDAGSLATTHRIVGLAAGTTYSFSVVATNAIGSSTPSSGASASTPASFGSESFGSLSADTLITATAVDGAGNTYVSGMFTGATLTLGGTTLTRIGATDAFAAKFNAAGNVLWAKNYGGSGATVVTTGIAVDASGNAYLSGYFGGANLTTPALVKMGGTDAFAFKLDGSGTPTWAKNYGASGANAYAKGIAVDGSGNVYLGGYFQGANLTAPALTLMGGTDVFAFKLDSSGATTWAKNFGGSGATTVASGIAVDGAGNVYLGGWFYTGNLTTPALTLIGTQDAFAFKLNASGVLTWARNFGGSGATAPANSIAVDASENVYLGGQFNANLTTPALTKTGTQDVFALKLDSSGTTTWAKNFGGSGTNAWATGIAADVSGNVFLGGYYQDGNFSTPSLPRIGARDGFAFKLDGSGTTTWSKSYGGSSGGAMVQITGIAADTVGKAYLGGYFGTANLTNPALTRIGSQDAFLVQSATSPSAPTGVTAVVGLGQATVTFTAPANGGSAITGYTVASNPAGGVDTHAGSTSLTHLVTGLTNGVSYTFTVTATNAVGTGPASAASNASVPGTVPGAPTGLVVVPGQGQVTVSFTPPASSGSMPITGYTVVSNPAGGVDAQAGTLATSHTVTGLTNGTSYTFTVVATSSVGAGPASAASIAVVVGKTLGGNGAAQAVVGAGSWLVNTAQSAGFIASTGHAKSPLNLPAGYSFPHGLLDFTLTGGTPSTSATLVLTYPSALPAGTVYWKYGPSPAGFDCANAPACAEPHWYRMPASQAVVSGNTVTLTITDGGVGDDDLLANGTIVDAGGPGVPLGGGVAGVPTLSQWGLLLLGLLMAGVAWMSAHVFLMNQCPQRVVNDGNV
ncbi:IPTL-CTERM sorting domain-containing protein [Hydrogenophaga soli]